MKVLTIVDALRSYISFVIFSEFLNARYFKIIFDVLTYKMFFF